MEVPVSSVVEFLKRVADDDIALSPEEKQSIVDWCALISSMQKQKHRIANRKDVKKQLKKKDKELVKDTGLRVGQKKGVTPIPRYTKEMKALSEVIDEREMEAEDILAIEEGPIIEDEAKESEQKKAKVTNLRRMCYCCKKKYNTIHHFYPDMCDACGDMNFSMRDLTANMTGKVALVTGARVKIGYICAMKLLRAGASVIAVTRFPHDAYKRYSLEPDYEEFKTRLEICAVDLRHTPSVERMCQSILQSYKELHIIINNACQTVRRPPAYYQHLIDAEKDYYNPLLEEGEALPAETASMPLIKSDSDEREKALFPVGQFDVDGQQIDLRTKNSWNLELAEVSTVELYEVQLVNAIAPYIINARLKPIMVSSNSRDRHIVNVSAMEGQFYRKMKTTKHPHTNMAKAALNMMTRTSAQDYANCGINMNSIDTGWVTDEHPIGRRRTEFSPPLDIIDGAARILHPIFEGMNTGKHVFGKFLKDYREIMW